jgi:diguanylate cyclase (GGDEF)-like protein
MMISMLIIYLNFQTRDLRTDHLTGANNRLHLEHYIKARIRNSTERKTFGAIMIDIDDFKSINDRFGHAVGDEALKNAVHILRTSLRRDDFIARFGGDEFIVIIDIQTKEELKDAVERIIANINRFNQKGSCPYNIRFSMGYDIYDPSLKMKPDDFVNHIDQLMYANKKADRKPFEI